MDKFLITLEVTGLLIGAGCLSRIPRNERSVRYMNLYTCIFLILSLYKFNTDLYYPVLMLGVLLGYSTCRIYENLNPRFESKESVYLQNELSKINTLCGMQVIKNNQLEHTMNKLNVTYCDINSDIRYLLNELSAIYKENDIEGNYQKLCQTISKLVPLLNKPSLIYIERNIELFNQLITKKDYKRAAKALREFRSEYYLGDGFDKELEYYLELLERGEQNAINRVK